MKKIIVIFAGIVFIAFSGCSKKEEEIKIKKPEEVKSEQKVDDNKELKDTTSYSENKDKEAEQKYMEHRNVKKIQSSEAKANIDQRVILKGYVADVAVREKVAYLNLDKKYPNNTCSITIFEIDFDKFGDFGKYKNKNIEVTGRVTEYKGKPQIIIKSPTQIKIVN
jgi:DNA/RNA endonuclease YhcR with UshA esterase domain